MEGKLFESEYKIMRLIWQYGTSTAKQICLWANEEYGWNKNTTYTIINKLIQKDCIERIDPGFLCIAKLVKKNAIQIELEDISQKYFEGSKFTMLEHMINEYDFLPEELEALKKLISLK